MHTNFILHSAIALLLALTPAPALSSSALADSGTRRDRAMALEQQGRDADAQSLWEAILRDHPADAEACAHLGFLQSRRQHYGQAVTLYRRALQLDPSMPGLRMNLGLALFKSGDPAGAATVFASLYSGTPPSSPDAQRLRILTGMADYGAGDYAAAIPWLKDAMARDPQNLPYRLVLAQSCLRARQFQCVLDVDREIVSLDPNSAEADMLTGEALDEMRDHHGALEQFRAAVQADPRLPGVHFGLGYLLWTQSQYPEAAREFQAELAINPGDVQALAYLADTDMRVGNTASARSRMQQALRRDPRLAIGYLDLGMMDADAGNREQALRELQKAAALRPHDVQIHWRLGRLYQAMGRRQEARAEFDRTKTLTQEQDESVFRKLNHQDAAPGQAGSQPPGAAAAHPD